MLNRQNEHFDERQLKIRGDVFQHSFFAAILLLLVNGFLEDFEMLWAPGRNRSLLILLAVVTFCAMEMILRDVYVGLRTCWADRIMLFFVLDAVLLLGISFYHLWSGAPLLSNAGLSEEGCRLVIATLIAAIPAVYFGKRLADRGKNAGE